MVLPEGSGGRVGRCRTIYIVCGSQLVWLGATNTCLDAFCRVAPVGILTAIGAVIRTPWRDRGLPPFL